MWLIVGLGNPGKEYASHRHNVGFMAVDALSERLRADAFREKFSAQWTKARHSDDDLVLLKPQTFMNLSGQSVQPAAAFFKVPVDHVLVLHDELDLPFGEVRLKVGGGHAGHNGLRSMIQSMGSADFVRVRIGVGRPAPGFRGEVADWVLSGFDPVERAQLPDVLGRSIEATLDVVARGASAATNKLNAAGKPPRNGPKKPDARAAQQTNEGSTPPSVAPSGGPTNR
jgi:PTH1 family peptidyl-tRNA hydrolase